MTVDLSTRYLGLTLPHPVVVGASPLVDDLSVVDRLAAAGAAAIVMHSLYEEQLTSEQLAHHHHVDAHHGAHPEARSYLPEPPDFALGPDEYLEQLARIKARVPCKVVGSLNGTTDRGWLDHARLIEEAGADALELSFYYHPTDADETAADVEARLLAIVRHVRAGTRLPLAVKLAPAFSSLPNLARRLAGAGAAGLVLFNRYYEPEIDPEHLELVPRLHLSTPAELPLRLRWLATLSDRVELSLAASGGVHGSRDALAAVMAGAHAVQMVSALLLHGPEHLAVVVRELREWLEQHEYESVDQARGSMSLDRCPDPGAYLRGGYLKILRGFTPR